MTVNTAGECDVACTRTGGDSQHIIDGYCAGKGDITTNTGIGAVGVDGAGVGLAASGGDIVQSQVAATQVD